MAKWKKSTLPPSFHIPGPDGAGDGLSLFGLYSQEGRDNVTKVIPRFDGGLEDLQLDIVGFLAILGEDAVRKTARLASLSSIFYLPRLMPAPHSLLYVERPENIESVRASVTAVHSGNQRDYLSHVTAALL
jgi:hypothetical protein